MFLRLLFPHSGAKVSEEPEIGRVIEPVSPGHPGRVQCQGTSYPAVTTGKDSFGVGSQVHITGRDGLKMMVERADPTWLERSKRVLDESPGIPLGGTAVVDVGGEWASYRGSFWSVLPADPNVHLVAGQQAEVVGRVKDSNTLLVKPIPGAPLKELDVDDVDPEPFVAGVAGSVPESTSTASAPASVPANDEVELGLPPESQRRWTIRVPVRMPRSPHGRFKIYRRLANIYTSPDEKRQLRQFIDMVEAGFRRKAQQER